MYENEQPISLEEEWREALEHPELGRSMRALCRAIYKADLILGGHWSRERLEEQLKDFVDAADYGAAGTLLALLCLREQERDCGS